MITRTLGFGQGADGIDLQRESTRRASELIFGPPAIKAPARVTGMTGVGEAPSPLSSCANLGNVAAWSPVPVSFKVNGSSYTVTKQRDEYFVRGMEPLPAGQHTAEVSFDDGRAVAVAFEVYQVP